MSRTEYARSAEPAPEAPRVAIIIVSYNSAKWLDACLESVYAHSGSMTLDVVVVDNNSTDGSRELVADRFPQARVLLSKNCGFAHANNRGFEAIDTPFVLFLNPDTIMHAGTLAGLVDTLRRRPTVGLMGCRQVDESGALLHTIRHNPSAVRYLGEALGSERFPLRASWMGERELDPAAYERDVSCDWVSGSFMLARREAVLDAGLMDERYFLYCEDPDLCAGVRAAGWEVRYSPEMTIVHYGGGDSSSASLEAQRAYARRQYMFKHQGRLQRNLSAAALALFYARRAAGLSARQPRARDKRAAARLALRTVLGIAPPPFGDLSGPLRTPDRCAPAARGNSRMANALRSRVTQDPR